MRQPSASHLWCEQCDGRVGPDHAAACQSPFCKARGWSINLAAEQKKGRIAAAKPQSGPECLGMSDDSNSAVAAQIKKSDAPQYVGVEEMTWQQWVEVPDNPRQRNTAQRAPRAKHLRTLQPTHAKVHVARLDDGRLIKLDGHTRAYKWAEGTLEPPAKIYADVYRCADVRAVQELYSAFDNSAAVENVTDKIYGAIRANNAAFSSELFRSNRFASALRTAETLLRGTLVGRQRDIYELFEDWLPEIELLDACGPTCRRFHSGVLAAALITIRRHGPFAAKFWHLFAQARGTKIDGEMDSIQALEERMEELRARRFITGRGNVEMIIRICLSAYDAFRRDHKYQTSTRTGPTGKIEERRGSIKAIQDRSLDHWLEQTKKSKRTWVKDAQA